MAKRICERGLEIYQAFSRFEDCNGFNLLGYLEARGLPLSKSKTLRFSPIDGAQFGEKYRVYVENN